MEILGSYALPQSLRKTLQWLISYYRLFSLLLLFILQGQTSYVEFNAKDLVSLTKKTPKFLF